MFVHLVDGVRSGVGGQAGARGRLRAQAEQRVRGEPLQQLVVQPQGQSIRLKS